MQGEGKWVQKESAAKSGGKWMRLNFTNKRTKGSLAVLCLSNLQPRTGCCLRFGTAAQGQTFHFHLREVRRQLIHNSFLLNVDYIWRQVIWKMNLVLSRSLPSLLWRLHVLADWNESHPAPKLLGTFPRGSWHEHKTSNLNLSQERWDNGHPIPLMWTRMLASQSCPRPPRCTPAPGAQWGGRGASVSLPPAAGRKPTESHRYSSILERPDNSRGKVLPEYEPSEGLDELYVADKK